MLDQTAAEDVSTDATRNNAGTVRWHYARAIIYVVF